MFASRFILLFTLLLNFTLHSIHRTISISLAKNNFSLVLGQCGGNFKARTGREKREKCKKREFGKLYNIRGFWRF